MRHLRFALLGLLALAGLLVGGPPAGVQAQSATYVVDTTSDANLTACTGAAADCSLRGAINNANGNIGADIINFSIGTGVPTINPGSALPTIVDPVTIDGTTEAAGMVELDGTSAGASVDGLNITAGSSTVRGLVINRFSGDGIELSTNGGNTIEGNYIGTDVTGATDLGNSQNGVYINGAPTNTIGGTTGTTPGGPCTGACNVISGNERGVRVSGSGATGNTVEGNYIGTDVNGTADRGNSLDGVLILQSASDNTIGGTVAGSGNVISGNNQTGVQINGLGSSGNTVEGNYIGTDVNGTADLGNSTIGVIILAKASGNTIGGTAAGARNVISGNGQNGVVIFGSALYPTSGNMVEGNYIGTDVTGIADLGNSGNGVLIDGALSNTIGGTAAGARNVIAGNNQNGVLINGSDATANKVEGNYIGTDVTGIADLGNLSDGVFILDGSNNTIGGTAAGEANIIAYNGGDGVRVDGASSTGNAIRGNSIHSNGGEGIENINGGNTELAPPVITAVGSASGTACANCDVDVFSDSEDEGSTYHGSAAADGSGNWSFPGAVSGPNVSATATDSSGNTSEFTSVCPVTGGDSDGDCVANGVDNCLSTPNGPGQSGAPGIGNQTNTDEANEAAGFRLGFGWPPPILAGDGLGDACDDNDDNDIFSDAAERHIYGVGPGSVQEQTPCRTDTVLDPWPVDITGSAGLPDGVVDGQDVVAVFPFVGLFDVPRFDLFGQTGVIDTSDLVFELGFLLMFCSPP